MLKPINFLIIFFVLLSNFSIAQEWMLKLRSQVELRKWKLTTKAEKTEKSLQGAAISLSKGSTVISQTTSNSDGDFEIDVPANGEFILTITYAGCNTKKFSVSTNGVPEGVGKDNYKPTISIGGFIMSKPIKSVDYIGLNEPLVKVEYKGKGQNFDKDEIVTNKGLEIVSKIYDAETMVINKFCATNKLGDDALNKKNCPLARSYYLKAISMLPDEQYPVEQLAKAEACIKSNEEKAKALADEAAQKQEASKAANDKRAAEKVAKEKAALEKAAKDKAVKENVAAQKTPSNDGKSTDIKPKNSVPTHGNENTTSDGKGNSKYKTPQVIGSNKYKETIAKADEFFKTKRYLEAKAAYTEALRIKPNDAYATKRLSEVKLLCTSK